ncbi:hypothetical protein [Jidongwangia harbinensis]|uniref:hypothetical protein n=1 Tax=Jidongwangia harbinensis TaxID=2878561 RepID=UPI001CDA09F9|nr:hypothetical protein [Jidongwangia harbinensis]MCA2212664.1 hypothetical protein [Jidongwangia harbinensis]
MASDLQPTGDPPTPAEAVVEFGPDSGSESGEPGRGRRWHLAGLAGSLAADRRVVPLAAAVGAVALFASLVSEWQITSVDTTPFGGTDAGNRQVAASIADLGALGAGYLAGLFVLAGAVVLLLFGPAAPRPYARLIGLTAGGVLLAVVAAMASDLDEVSRSIARVYLIDLDAEDVVLRYGRGLWCAVFGVAATVLALYLAGRHLAVAAPDATADATVPEPEAVWSWRRPRTATEEEPPVDEPFDLTVSPVTPFMSLSDDRDKATERDKPSGGISG